MNKEIDIPFMFKVRPEVKKMIEDNVRAVVKPFIEKNETLRAELARVTAERDALVEANRWIPVGERMPPDFGPVIVTDTIMENVAIGWIFVEDNATSWCWRGHINRVDYWMPLPEPPP